MIEKKKKLTYIPFVPLFPSLHSPLRSMCFAPATVPSAYPADDDKVLSFWRSIDAFQTGQALSRAGLEKRLAAEGVKAESSVGLGGEGQGADATAAKVLEGLKGPGSKGQFSFYDGPPFATGLPHYGHLLLGTIKVGCKVFCAVSYFLSTLTNKKCERNRLVAPVDSN